MQEKDHSRFWMWGGNYSKLFAEVATKVYGLDNKIALDFARKNNSLSNIEYTNNPPKTDITVFLDCLEFIPNWVEIYERYKSPTNYIICPNFQAASPRIVRLLKRFSFRKNRQFAEIKKIEQGKYHTMYNREFVQEFEKYIKNCEKIPFTRTLYFLHRLFSAHESFLYIVKNSS